MHVDFDLNTLDKMNYYYVISQQEYECIPTLEL